MSRYSRFFRDAFGQEFYLRKLAKQGVKLVSITQPLGDDDDPSQAMMRKVIALFDEYQSKENAKHVLRNMKLNAEQGFWNGSLISRHPHLHQGPSAKAEQGFQDKLEKAARAYGHPVYFAGADGGGC